MKIDALETLLKDAVKDTGLSLSTTTRELAAYIAERAVVLASAVGLPGYEQAVIAERDNVLLKSGRSAVSTADAADQRLLGIVTTALALL